MTPLKKDLAMLEFNVFFHIVNIDERWRLCLPILKNNWKQSIQPEYIVK